MISIAYEDIIETAITELIESGYYQQRKEDEEMDQLVKQRIELKDQVVLYTRDLDERAKQALEHYHDTIESINGVQLKYIYLQGAKDCIRLLKSLGVF